MKAIKLALAAFLLVGALGAGTAAADCCDGGACCKNGACCRTHQAK
jgi:hypothetical protein